MIEIKQGKVYRLRTGGLFVAEHRHEHPNEPQNNHWLFRRITLPSTWEGYGDPLIFDHEHTFYEISEATEEEYLDYEDRYLEEQDRLLEELDKYRTATNEMARRRLENWPN